MIHEWKARVPIAEQREDAAFQGAGVEVAANDIIQLSRCQLQSAEEVAKPQGTGSLILVREAEPMGGPAFGDPKEELPRHVLAVPMPLMEVHDEFKARTDAGEGALDLVGEEEAPDPTHHLPHAHEIPVERVVSVVQKAGRVALVGAG